MIDVTTHNLTLIYKSCHFIWSTQEVIKREQHSVCVCVKVTLTRVSLILCLVSGQPPALPGLLPPGGQPLPGVEQGQGALGVPGVGPGCL